ncbi:hypothetical protein PIROE2DRAFT_19007 [Piromyces sp. E2]|nr:hypothetical protein PIROE2DRAFT_19007 [Piromyces sp. E2]|eukprot:OUM56399.1 hypothetical protein PIROE2DRAFT_19007 [Piromyces sp. E2]
MNIQAEALKDLVSALDSVLSNSINNSSSNSTTTNSSGKIVITSYNIPSNHLDNSNSFKGKDTDVERFLAMCKRQFGFYTNFYTLEKKRVEFIEAHLGSASEWYYIFMSEKQREKPNSGLLLGELAKYFSTNIPDNIKLNCLLKLSHRWGNAVEFVTKFKLYSTQLAIPNVLQILPTLTVTKEIMVILDSGSGTNFVNKQLAEDWNCSLTKFISKQLAEDWNFPLLPTIFTTIFPNKIEEKCSTTKEIPTHFELPNEKGKLVGKDGYISYFSGEYISPMDLQLSLEDLNNKEVSFVTLEKDPDYNLKLLSKEYWKYSSVFNKVGNKSLQPTVKWFGIIS